jgi:signal transduction histidine kinase
MTLSRKMTFKIIGLVMGLSLLSGVSLWGLRGIRGHLRLARDEYAELRMIQSAVLHAAAAKARLQASDPNDEAVLTELEARDEELNAVLELQYAQDREGFAPELFDRAAAKSALTGLRDALDRLQASSGDYAAAVGAIEQVLAHLDELARQMDSTIASAQQEADQHLETTIAVIAILSGVILLATTLMNVGQYRGIVRPLRRLREGVERMAGGRFGEPVHVAGATEFTALARDFNRMAEELDQLYRTLEAKVEAKSKELVRSERLASVGFLAAGVAHEINNPLHIISAHAELMLKRLAKTAGDSRSDDGTTGALQIIRDESFRCKEIIEKLLSLARFGDAARERVSAATVVRDVVSMVLALKQTKDRYVVLKMDPTDDLAVWGNSTELKQVMLNLVLNAFEAAPPGAGEVCVEGSRAEGWIELSVCDNGRGMTERTLQRVFEPFFTERRSSNGRGLGLGLSISHAIVESHGGRISAHSDGPNRGSRFQVLLPVFSESTVGR